MRYSLSVLFALIILSACCALADTLVVTESGTFSSGTPASNLTAPGGTYSFSFRCLVEPGCV
jgi:hypothetical protein